MNRFVSALALVCLTIPVAAAAPTHLLTLSELRSRPHAQPSATVHYGSDPLQVVDVWLPAGKGPFPTVLMIHGGCWTTRIADRHIMDWLSDDLRKRGIAVWNIDYRGVDRPGGGYPGTFLDVAAGADALREHASEFNLDTRHVPAIGHSAGGHLALWLAARSKLPASSPLHSDHPFPVAAVISLGGLPDLELAGRVKNGCGTEVSRKLAAGHFDETSVPRLGPIRVPQYLVNGLQDPIIPAQMATDYRQRMQAAGDRVHIDWIPASGHFDLIDPNSRAWSVAVKRLGEIMHRDLARGS